MTKLDKSNIIKDIIKQLQLEGFDREQITEIMKYGVLYLNDKNDRVRVREMIDTYHITQKDITRFFDKDEEIIHEFIDSIEKEEAEEVIVEDVIEELPIGEIIEEPYIDKSDEEMSDVEVIEESNTEKFEREMVAEILKTIEEMPLAEEKHEKDEIIQPEEIKKEQLSAKGQKLYEKVEKLEQKIRQEKNPLKLPLLKFKLRTLLAKIQRELDLINIKENYKLQREELKVRKLQSDKENTKEIALLMKKINLKKQELLSNSEYDYKSTDFGFYGIVKNETELHTLTASLKEDSETKSVAEDIERMVEIRAELEHLQTELKNRREMLINSDKIYAVNEKRINKEEKRSDIKYNVWQRIKDFFKNISAEAKDINTNFIEMRKIKKIYRKQKIHAILSGKEKIAVINAEQKQAQQLQRNYQKERFFSNIKLTGEELAKANEPVQTEPLEQEVQAPVQEETL